MSAFHQARTSQRTGSKSQARLGCSTGVQITTPRDVRLVEQGDGRSYHAPVSVLTIAADLPKESTTHSGSEVSMNRIEARASASVFRPRP